ncbi:ermin [Varanus komodoensis]|uniref:ermin n=1 Tax=Varanus komodoensis TaxID=61221 RepID=UPI001CF7BEA0|nr:ermin [Varanus komodoensis]
MTDDVQVPTSMSEYKRNMPSEKPQIQVIDIIDQIANSVEIFPYETDEPKPGFLLTQENQEGNISLAENTVYDGSVEAKEMSLLYHLVSSKGKPGGNKEEKDGVSSQETRDWEEESGEELCVENHPLSTEGHEVTKPEEWDAQQLQDEKAPSTNEAEEDQEEVPLNEPKEQIKEDTQLEANEDAADEDSDGTEGEQKENNEELHKQRQEENRNESLPTSPSCHSQTETANEQTGSLKINDISRHSYSRYNTISYRKIRKGNTKQRIDEFESMMHS